MKIEKKNYWYDWLIRYILEIVEITKGKIKYKIPSLLKGNPTENYRKPPRAKNVYKVQKLCNTVEEKLISNTSNFFLAKRGKGRLLQNRKSR